MQKTIKSLESTCKEDFRDVSSMEKKETTGDINFINVKTPLVRVTSHLSTSPPIQNYQLPRHVKSPSSLITSNAKKFGLNNDK